MSLVNGFAEGALVKLTQLLLQITHGTHVGESVCVCVWGLYAQTGSMAQAAADPLAVESTWIDVPTLDSETKKKPNV